MSGDDYSDVSVSTGQELATRHDGAGVTIRDLRSRLDAYQKQISMLVPRHVDPQQLVAIAVLAAQKEPRLRQCDQQTFVSAVLKCAQAGLIPDGEQAIIVPYRNRKRGIYEAQFQAGYPGLLRLAHQEEKIESVHAYEIYENDHFEVEFGESMTVVHKPFTGGDRGNIVGAYGIVWLRDARRPVIDYIDRNRLDRIKRKSQSPVWSSWPERMAKKSALTAVLKYVPKSRELGAAIQLTEQSEIGAPQNLDLEMDPTITLDQSEVEEVEHPVESEQSAEKTAPKTRREKKSKTEKSDQQSEPPPGDPAQLTPEELAELAAERDAIENTEKKIDVPFDDDQKKLL